MSLPSLSIVLPCHNEQDVLPVTIARLDGLVSGWIGKSVTSCQYVLVNNGSTDGTLKTMLALKSTVSLIEIVDLRRNYGYQGSISAGLYHSDADAVVTIDADLQDDPEKIEEMLQHFANGFELVLGVRKARRSDSLCKRVLSQQYYRLLNVLGVESVYNHGDFRLMSRALVAEFKQIREVNRYIRAMILHLDSRYACVYYDRRSRELGTSKFRTAHLLALALDGITSFSSVPIRLVTVSGIAMAMLSFAVLGYVLYVLLLTERNVPGWASLASIVLFFAGAQTFFLGIVGEYVAKTYLETKQRPLFTVRKTYSAPIAQTPSASTPGR